MGRTVRGLWGVGVGCLLIAGAVQAGDTWTLGGDVVIDMLGVHDTAGGLSHQRMHEAMGVHNNHAAEAHGHGELGKGLNLRGVEGGLSATWQGRWTVAARALAEPGGQFKMEEWWLGNARDAGGVEGLGLKLGQFAAPLGLSAGLHPHERAVALAPLGSSLLLGEELRVRGAMLGVEVADILTSTQLGWPRVEWMASRANNAGVANIYGPTVLTNVAGQPRVPLSPRASGVGWWALQMRWDVGSNEHPMRWGFWTLRGRQHQELHEPHPGVNLAWHAMQGRTRTDGAFAEFGWPTAWGDMTLQAEYWLQRKALKLVYHQLQPVLAGQPRDLTEDSLLLQGRWQPLPDWTFGAQYERVGGRHEASRAGATVGPRNTSYFAPTERRQLWAEVRPAPGHRVQLVRHWDRVLQRMDGTEGVFAPARGWALWYVYQHSWGGGHAH